MIFTLYIVRVYTVQSWNGLQFCSQHGKSFRVVTREDLGEDPGEISNFAENYLRAKNIIKYNRQINILNLFSVTDVPKNNLTQTKCLA